MTSLGRVLVALSLTIGFATIIFVVAQGDPPTPRYRGYHSLMSPDFGSTDPEELIAEVEGKSTPDNIEELVRVASGEGEPSDSLTREDVGHLIRHLRAKSSNGDPKARLDYEAKAKVRPSKQAPETLTRLKRNENSSDAVNEERDHALRRLHNSEAAHFVLRTGNGYERYQPPGVEYLRLHDYTLTPIDPGSRIQSGDRVSLPTDEPTVWDLVGYDYEDADAEYQAWARENNPLTLPTVPRLEGLHAGARSDFAVERRGTQIETAEGSRWVGFDRHRITRAVSPKVAMPLDHQIVGPTSRLDRSTEKPEKLWHLSQMHLVSLLRHEEPRAYVSYYLPAMEELEDKPTRDLDSFEADALEKLYDGEDIVTDAHMNRIVMLGSLRASKDCLECHDVDRGDLLGAFSYRLERVHPKPVEVDRKVTAR